MRHAPIDPALFVSNRERLRSLLLPGSLVVVNANDIPQTNSDGTLRIVPNSDLFWLTGVEQEESVLLLFPDADDKRMREILFLRETSDLIAIWEGHKLTQDEARAVTGIENIQWLSQLPQTLHRLACEASHLYLNSNEHKRAEVVVESRDARFVRWMQERYPLHSYQRLAPLMHRLRVRKSDAEVALLQDACDITKAGFERVCRFVRPGVNEREVEAEFAHEFIRRRAGFAYNPIIASGKSACVLHYIENNSPCHDGDLLLLDVAASSPRRSVTARTASPPCRRAGSCHAPPGSASALRTPSAVTTRTPAAAAAASRQSAMVAESSVTGNIRPSGSTLVATPRAANQSTVSRGCQRWKAPRSSRPPRG